MDSYLVTFADSIESVGKDNWDSLVGSSNPFTRYEFLAALERTACTTSETGWVPQHVVVTSVASDSSTR